MKIFIFLQKSPTKLNKIVKNYFANCWFLQNFICKFSSFSKIRLLKNLHFYKNRQSNPLKLKNTISNVVLRILQQVLLKNHRCEAVALRKLSYALQNLSRSPAVGKKILRQTIPVGRTALKSRYKKINITKIKILRLSRWFSNTNKI